VSLLGYGEPISLHVQQWPHPAGAQRPMVVGESMNARAATLKALDLM
jgi:hypothetical protein